MDDELIKELNDLTRWEVIAGTIDKDGLLNRINELRNKINNKEIKMNDYDLYGKIESLKHKIASYKLFDAHFGLCYEEAKDLYLMQSKLKELQNRLYENQQATDNEWRNW